jgi:hypothetical protein
MAKGMNRFALQYDRDYGIDRRSGWSVVSYGRVVVQFVSLPRALWVAVRCWLFDRDEDE